MHFLVFLKWFIKIPIAANGRAHKPSKFCCDDASQDFFFGTVEEKAEAEIGQSFEENATKNRDFFDPGKNQRRVFTREGENLFSNWEALKCGTFIVGGLKVGICDLEIQIPNNRNYENRCNEVVQIQKTQTESQA